MWIKKVIYTGCQNDIAGSGDRDRTAEGGTRFGHLHHRIPLKKGFDPFGHGRRIKISAPRCLEVLFGRTAIDLGDLEQIVSISQTRGLAHAILHAAQYMDGKRTPKEVVECVLGDVAVNDLECLTPYLTGDIAPL